MTEPYVGDAGGEPPIDVLVVGGGVTGLATGFWLSRLAPGKRVVVAEAAPEPGGKARTQRVDAYRVDVGPGTLDLDAPEVRSLVRELGLDGHFHVPQPHELRRYVVRAGRLVALPSGPLQALTSPVLSLRGKLAALGELSRPPHAGDESVHEFLARRFGEEVATGIGQALVSGMVAGDPRRLSVTALLPRLKALEDAHGSVLRGMRESRKAGATNRRRLGSLEDGMGTLCDALAGVLGDRLITDAEATEVVPLRGGYEVRLAGRPSIRAHQLILATPAYVSARLLEGLAPDIASELEAVAYVDVDVVALGFRRSEVGPADGFGFLAARGEGVRSLGVIYASETTPGAAPDDAVLFRAIAGGALDPDFSGLSDDEKVAEVRRDLRQVMSITAAPTFSHVVRHDRAIPQYDLGHLARVDRIERSLGRLPGIRLSGDAYRGVGLTDRLREAVRTAESMAASAPTTVVPR